MPASGASTLGVFVASPTAAGGVVSCMGRLTTEAPRVSLVDVVGSGCFSRGDIVQADDAIATASQGNKMGRWPAHSFPLPALQGAGRRRNRLIVFSIALPSV